MSNFYENNFDNQIHLGIDIAFTSEEYDLGLNILDV